MTKIIFTEPCRFYADASWDLTTLLRSLQKVSEVFYFEKDGEEPVVKFFGMDAEPVDGLSVFTVSTPFEVTIPDFEPELRVYEIMSHVAEVDGVVVFADEWDGDGQYPNVDIVSSEHCFVFDHETGEMGHDEHTPKIVFPAGTSLCLDLNESVSDMIDRIVGCAADPGYYGCFSSNEACTMAMRDGVEYRHFEGGCWITILKEVSIPACGTWSVRRMFSEIANNDDEIQIISANMDRGSEPQLVILDKLSWSFGIAYARGWYNFFEGDLS